MNETLKDLFKNKIKNNNIHKKLFNSILKENTWIYDQYYNDYKIKNNLFSSFEEYLKYLIFDIKLKTCQHCGNYLTYYQTIKNMKFCSNKCKLSKGSNPSSRNDIKEKIKNNLIEKYGVDNVAKLNETKEKIKKTNLEKYGVENTFQLIDKIKETNLEKYGVDNYAKTKECQIKKKLTNNKKYNASHKNVLTAWNKIINQKDAIPLFSFEDFKSNNHETEYLTWKCKYCNKEFKSRWDNGGLSCKCNCQYIHGYSTYEKELADFCKLHFSNIIENDRKLIKPYELDIIIPNIKLALEFNGSFWHSKQINSRKNYHLNKILKCNEKGYRLIHIWEDEWTSNKEEIKRKLTDIFKGNEIIDFSKPLDRSWYNNLNVDKPFKETPPEIIKRNNFNVFNAGYIIY